ncbi:acetyl-CoA carboxylase [Candidatus Paracaedimonas acanthamoebae]|nr:acetyl-CoA carboxylase [Candidatus Paracaedimonas acanthamoebae]
MTREKRMANPLSFDEKIVRKLAEILNETGLSEIEIEQENSRLRVARNLTAVATVEAPTVTSTQAMAASAPQEVVPVDVARHPGTVKAPMVGTVYAASTPGAEPFVKVGAKVTQGQTLLIIEAMKVMNQIRAPQEGTVSQILFNDGDPVEFDQPLLIIE